ncbi:uncharacterized protein LOC123257850 [Drosophila ananassae]|uniref:uncharacterized protein LOC123257850 n=1 Tax=Drosophila ananassae TaxID=7217 RepID=UPI001CFFE88F|nr:uncharacterized protein LOC123257850 [Drosophila ananassae]
MKRQNTINNTNTNNYNNTNNYSNTINNNNTNNNNNLIETGLIIITFETHQLPEILRVGYETVRTFEGEPGKFVSWVYRAQAIVNDYEIIIGQPLYRTIILYIRQKIRGDADLALSSYNVEDDNWSEIKRVLSLHNADKRDVRTLEYQLSQLTQAGRTLEQFYNEVNNHFSLILNKLKQSEHAPNVASALTEMYRDKALDVFVRGLNGDASKLLIIRGPKNLPEAYSFCLELQNVSVRGNARVEHANRFAPFLQPRYPISAPRYAPPVSPPRYSSSFQPPIRAPAGMNFNDSSSGNSRGFNRFQGPRPAIKMESNRSGQSYQSGFGLRRGNDDRSQNTSPGSNPFRKAQRLYHMTAVPSSVVTMPEDDTQNSACQTTFEDEAVSAHDTSLEYDVPYHKADDENVSDERNGNKLKFLIDTGANKNFVSQNHSAGSIPLSTPFFVESAAGNVRITHCLVGRFFEPIGNDLITTFYVLPGLNSFDGIIGDDTLKEAKALIDRKNDLLLISPGIKLPLLARYSSIAPNHSNALALIDGDHDDDTKQALDNLIKEFPSIFEPLSSGEAKPKPNGEQQYRMVIDFNRLNAVTISDTYPIPDINSTPASLGRAKYFTTIDLTSGFHQIHMNEKDIPKTAFSTLNGKYEFLRLPFGLKNAPTIFQRMIDDVLREHICKICYVYIDDYIIVFVEDYQRHWNNLRAVFQNLRKAKLHVNLEKTRFLSTQVESLGYIVTQDGIKANAQKVKAITDMKPPLT